jgi:hypothetical protein
MEGFAAGSGLCVVAAALADIAPLPVSPFVALSLARWCGAGALVLASLFLSIARFHGLTGRHLLALPLTACAAGVVALAVVPVEGALRLAWVPVIVNAGGIVGAVRSRKGKG